eukprot:CAMPEP_0173173512 /NCGR_PEP_ID=MMETSP1141-20130122/2868_1 /TAXON_ID=483371 /ORGANISM="non described non described, Strain CCMP2298" /LENGTH=79 /DNA_ID=CAMNT_0014095593 /DNA_START=832 /DNA_END=1071 /DNA_ORIENTATION=+
MKIQGRKGSKGTSCRKAAEAKKKPAATKGAYRGMCGAVRSKAIEEPRRIICHSICALANSESHMRKPMLLCHFMPESGG